jgi:hypothetical protein
VRVADHQTHTGQGGNFFRGALGVATRHHDAGVGLLPMDAADGLAKLIVGGGGYGTGV